MDIVFRETSGSTLRQQGQEDKRPICACGAMIMNRIGYEDIT